MVAAAVGSGRHRAPVRLPTSRVQQSEGFGRTLFEACNHSASWQSYTQVPPVNLLYGRTGVLAPRAPAPGQPDRQGVEHWMFPGLVLLALAGVGLVSAIRGDGRPLVEQSSRWSSLEACYRSVLKGCAGCMPRSPRTCMASRPSERQGDLRSWRSWACRCWRPWACEAR